MHAAKAAHMHKFMVVPSCMLTLGTSFGTARVCCISMVQVPLHDQPHLSAVSSSMVCVSPSNSTCLPADLHHNVRRLCMEP